ncbi:MAG: ATP-binding cassette domain-containing protein [Ktedonobacteraceae bacterium]|nr:ATP-binding cassette domain-containing protein [Ktedonobacteraceae bacterium]
MALLETVDLRKSFRTRRTVVEAVRGVTLSVDAGEIFGFLGPNGAGKTTTLRMLTTLLPPDGGQARVAGYNLLREAARIREQIGYVSQSGGVDINATGRENVLLQAQLYHIKETKQRTAELLALLQLEHCADRLASTYSGGERRRLAVAMGLVHRPALLFLDEPTTGLDPQSRAHLWDEIRTLRKNGTTVFLTTHYLEEADMLCDRLAIIDHGTIVAEGTPASLKRSFAHDAIMLGLDRTMLAQAQQVLQDQPFIKELQPREEELRLYVEDGSKVLPLLVQALGNAHIAPRTITLAQPTLDDVFLRITGRSLRENGENAQNTGIQKAKSAAGA